MIWDTWEGVSTVLSMSKTSPRSVGSRSVGSRSVQYQNYTVFHSKFRSINIPGGRVCLVVNPRCQRKSPLLIFLSTHNSHTMDIMGYIWDIYGIYMGYIWDIYIYIYMGYIWDIYIYMGYIYIWDIYIYMGYIWNTLHIEYIYISMIYPCYILGYSWLEQSPTFSAAGWWYTYPSEKNMKVNGKDYPIWKINMFETTNQNITLIWSYMYIHIAIRSIHE